MTKVVRLLLVLGVVCGACAVEDTLSAPYCEGSGSGLIEAQSVPSAEFIPCITELPPGWTIESVRINQGGTVIRFESDRAGEDAGVFRYEETCEIGEAGLVLSAEPAIELYRYNERAEPAYRASWYNVFEGGCGWWQFDFLEGVSSRLAHDLAGSLGWISRDDLNANIAETFVDETLE